ncbi:hypothetical protein EJ02DRAFT_454235 [Clathrospora elynae]|uniref:Uncharacterized protein n=1 Tax=Clathrospora elynae TaxID=706981 RepID=A0A6A5SS96_9PLEO|nr:hypothetical protein EJ02DRAFT_454235 [Clathrospora elynae]
MAPAPIEARAHHDHAAGETTVCHLKNFGACHDNLINAMDRCANFDPGYGFPSSLMQYQGVFCKWYRDFGCSGRGDAMVIDSRGETVKMGDLGADDSMFRSVRCQDSPW